MNILEGTNLSIQVKNRNLFSGFSFEIKEQEKVLLKGESGSGKSTLLHAILGFYPLEQGIIYFKNQKLDASSIHEFRKHTVYVPQTLKFSFDTVEELLLFPFDFRHNKNRKPSRKKIEKWLHFLELPDDLLDTAPDDISGGEMQRIIIIASLLQEKPVYLMDEPTSAMDQELRKKVLEAIRNTPASLLVTSHDEIWEQYVDRVITFSGNQNVQTA